LDRQSKGPQTGHSVARLLSTYGPETFTALCIRTSHGNRAQRSMIFLDVVDRAPEEMVLGYQNSAKEYYPAMGAACGRRPVISWHEDAATWRFGGRSAPRGRRTIAR